MQNEQNFWHVVEFITNDDNDESLMTVSELTNSKGSEILNDSGKNLIMRAYYNADENITSLLERINNTLKDFPNIKINSHSQIQNQSWATQYIDAFPPLNVGENIVVAASWHEKSLNPDKINLLIFPACAFGTGYHESTQIALMLLEDAFKNYHVKNILDVGTGSGILSIAAVKLGAEKVYARDIDPAVLDEVKRNFELNKINPENYIFEVGDLLKNFDYGKVGAITANILLAPNLELVPEIQNVLKNNGVAIFSGMTKNEQDIFKNALAKTNLKIVREIELNDWWGCEAVLNS